jgi:hypothetical protein
VWAFFATVIGFALIWQIWWMLILGLIGDHEHAASPKPDLSARRQGRNGRVS